MKLKNAILVGGMKIPAGTDLQFNAAGFCQYKNVMLSKAGLESLGAEIEAEQAEHALPVPEDNKIRLEILVDAWRRRKKALKDAGITVIPAERTGNMVVLDIVLPSNPTSAIKLTKILAELGFDADDIIKLCPMLAGMTGLASRQYIDAVLDPDRGYNLNNYSGTIQR